MSKPVALITGASSGLGLALACHLGNGGWKVVGCARKERQIGTMTVHPVDVSDAQAVANFILFALIRYGPIDVLFNNAAIFRTEPPLGRSRYPGGEQERLGQVLRTNVMGPWNMAHAIAGEMRRLGRGRIVNITSAVTLKRDIAGRGIYAASKAALNELTRAWASELKGSGVTVCAVCPGPMQTAMHAGGAEPAAVAPLVASLAGRDIDDGRILFRVKDGLLVPWEQVAG